ncbi:MAG: hypothetical protein ABSB78_07160 [Bacteroidota bacterium]
MSNISLDEIAIIVLVILVLAIPITFSYTAIRKRRAVGKTLLQWRPGPIRLALIFWCILGVSFSVILYQYSTSRYAKLIFLGAFFSGLMNVLGSTIVIGEHGIFIYRRSILWKNISQFSVWEKDGKHHMSVTWSDDDSAQKEQTVNFVIPRRMVKVTLALFQNFIPSIQLPRSN